MEPFVSIVTPFYNTQADLAECIESILRQTYRNWEYLLVDNCSTDGSDEIAKSYASRSTKVRVVHAEVFRSQVQNYNYALSLASRASRYCKVVQADDWLYPECIERMVSVAESDATVGIVSSYRLKGNQVLGAGLSPAISIVSGRELCRSQLTSSLFTFGTPTTVLYRSDAMRAMSPVFDEATFFDDTDLCYRVLESWNLGFVHQVLSFSRVDENSIRGKISDFGPDLLERLVHLKKFGPNYLSEEELQCARAQATKRYYEFLARHVLAKASKEFWAFQRAVLAYADLQIDKRLIARSLSLTLLDVLANPGSTCARLYRRLRSKRRPSQLEQQVRSISAREKSIVRS